jgi:hypothetical protein
MDSDNPEPKSIIKDGSTLLEFQKPKASCGDIPVSHFSNAYENRYGAPYPSNPPPYEIPHNIFRFFKKIPKKLLPKLFALTHLDIVMREILLATISLDGPGREKLVQELERLAHELKEPINKLMQAFGDSMKSVLQAIPGLNIVYAISDISEVIKQGNVATGEVSGTLTQFIDKVDDIYKRSAGSNRLVSSLLYSVMDFLNEHGESGLQKAAEKRVGKHIMGPAGSVPIDTDVTSSSVSRVFSNEALRKGLTSLLEKAEKSEDIKDIQPLVTRLKESITSEGTGRDDVTAGMKQEISGVKGLGELRIVDSIYKGLSDKYDKRRVPRGTA